MVTTPETIHAMSSQNGELTVREISAETMKIPDPIIEPATSIVASVSVSALTNSRDDGVSAVAVVLVNALPQCSVSSRCFPPVQRAEVTVGDTFLLVEPGLRIEDCGPNAIANRRLIADWETNSGVRSYYGVRTICAINCESAVRS